MKLSDFVSSTLTELQKGVQKAKKESGVWVAPGLVADQQVWSEQLVAFDVAVVSSADGGGEISVWGMGKLKGGTTSQSTNRISFSVPVYFQAIGSGDEEGS